MPLNWKKAVSQIPASVPLHAVHAMLITLGAIAWVLASVLTVSAADVNAVRLWRAPDHTRLVLDLSEAAEFSTLSLDNPERFVIDLSQSRLTASLNAPRLSRSICATGVGGIAGALGEIQGKVAAAAAGARRGVRPARGPRRAAATRQDRRLHRHDPCLCCSSTP